MSFWQGRKVFITGHTGLRGSWLALQLHKKSAQVFGYSLPATTLPNFFEVGQVTQCVTSTFSDIRDYNSLKSALDYSQAEIVFHLAGGAGLKESWQNPAEIYSTQVLGTVNLLEALRETSSVRALVVLSSDKVYRPVQQVQFFNESAPLGGSNPASTSKACVELIVESYLRGFFAPEKYNKHKISLATARMGAVIGGGDFSPDSFVYQLALAAQAGVDVPLKNPGSLRAWMHIDDAIDGLLKLGEALLQQGPKFSGAWNFGCEAESMATVEDIKKCFMSLTALESVKDDGGHAVQGGISRHSGLDCSKAAKELGWRQTISPSQAASLAAQWYLRYFSGQD